MKTLHIIPILLCLFFIGCKEPLIGDPKMMSKISFKDAVKLDECNILPTLSKAGTVDVSTMTINVTYIQEQPYLSIEKIIIHLFGKYPNGTEIRKTSRKYGKKGNIEFEETEIIKPLINIKQEMSIGFIISISSTIGLIIILLFKFVEYIIFRIKKIRRD